MAMGGKGGLEGLHDGFIEFLCSVCTKKKRKTEAERFCNDCQDYYCKNCVRVHDDVPALSDHDIINRSQLKLGSSLKFPEVPTERCHEHSNKSVDRFCISHNSVGCTNCMETYHSECKTVYIPDHVKNNFNLRKSIKFENNLERLAESLHDLEEEYEKEREHHRSRRENLVKKIRTFRTQINQRIDELENNTLKELDCELKSLNTKIQKEINDLKTILKRVEHAKDSIDFAGRNISQQFVSMMIASEVAEHAEAVIKKAIDKHTPAGIGFIADQTLLSLLNQMQNIGKICEINTSQIKSSAIYTRQRQAKTQGHDKLHSNKGQLKYPNSDHVKERSNEEAKDHAYDMSQQISRLNLDQVPAGRNKSSILKIKGCNKYPVKIESDKKTCDIISACELGDDTLILVDHSNKKLKCLNISTFTVTDSCDLPGYPFQVCAVSPVDVAVACGEAEMIQFVSVEGSSLQQTRSISTDCACYGVAYADGKLYVACVSSASSVSSVYVYTRSGTRLNKFPQDRPEKTLFNSLVISKEHCRIYVADEHNGLIILSISGKPVGQFNPPELDGAYRVCLHKNGNVLVCGYRSNSVLQLSADGQLIGKVLKTDKTCHAICFINNYSQLVIGYKKDNEIKIHDIL